jgi:hypothetical protein
MDFKYLGLDNVDWIHGGKVWVKELGGMNTIAKFDFHN